MGGTLNLYDTLKPLSRIIYVGSFPSFRASLGPGTTKQPPLPQVMLTSTFPEKALHSRPRTLPTSPSLLHQLQEQSCPDRFQLPTAQGAEDPPLRNPKASTLVAANFKQATVPPGLLRS